jgi:hypothetical protein
MSVLSSLGYDLAAGKAFLAVPLIALCVSLPVSIQGIGVREATYVALLGAVGVPAEVAVSASVLSFTLTVCVSMLGAGVMVTRATRTLIRARTRSDTKVRSFGQNTVGPRP